MQVGVIFVGTFNNCLVFYIIICSNESFSKELFVVFVDFSDRYHLMLDCNEVVMDVLLMSPS